MQKPNFFLHYWPAFVLLFAALIGGAFALAIFTNTSGASRNTANLYVVVLIIGIVRGFMMGVRSEKSSSGGFADWFLSMVFPWLVMAVLWPVFEFFRQTLFLIRAISLWRNGEIIVDKDNPSRVMRWA